MTVQEFRVVVAWSGAFVAIAAFAVCLLANHLNRQEGLAPEAPSLITGLAAMPALILVFIFVAKITMFAATAGDPCERLRGDDSWTAWWIRLTTGC